MPATRTSWRKHRVTRDEAEQVFGNRPILIELATSEHAAHASEYRDAALGRTNADRWLFVAFTVRGSLLRVISAREMSARERRIYEATIEQANR